MKPTAYQLSQIEKEKNYWSTPRSLSVRSIGSDSYRAWELRHHTDSYSSASLYITGSPFKNCQNFTIGNAAALANIPNFVIARILVCIIYRLVKKYQFIIDVKDEHVSSIKLKLRPYLKSDIKEQPYTSTNGSKMNILLIVLDRDVIKELLAYMFEKGLHDMDSFKENGHKQAKLEAISNTITKPSSVVTNIKKQLAERELAIKQSNQVEVSLETNLTGQIPERHEMSREEHFETVEQRLKLYKQIIEINEKCN